MKTRFVITSINAAGLRAMTFNNNHFNTYETLEQAQEMLNNVTKNNDPEYLKQICGTDFKILPVECYPGGDSTRTIF